VPKCEMSNGVSTWCCTVRSVLIIVIQRVRHDFRNFSVLIVTGLKAFACRSLSVMAESRLSCSR